MLREVCEQRGIGEKKLLFLYIVSFTYVSINGEEAETKKENVRDDFAREE